MTKALAAVFHRPEEPLELRQFDLPKLKVGELLVEISLCTLCGSDLHTMHGARSVAGPTVLGHEMLGRVVELAGHGDAVRDVTGRRIDIGDRITWSVAASCGTCFFCIQGLPQKCERLFKYGHETVDRHPLSGGLAEFCHLVPGTAIVRVPESLPDNVACPANCATATVAAALRTANGCEGKTVLIHGAGMLGLTAAAMATQQGAASVIVTDIADERLELASTFGATHTANAKAPSVLTETLSHVTNGRGADVIFELSGSTDAVEQSVAQLRIGGQLVLVGSVFPTPAAEFFPEQIIRKLLRIDGVHNYKPHDLQVATQFLVQVAAGYPFSSLVSEQVSLADVNQAVTYAATNKVPRVAVSPQPAS